MLLIKFARQEISACSKAPVVDNWVLFHQLTAFTRSACSGHCIIHGFWWQTHSALTNDDGGDRKTTYID